VALLFVLALLLDSTCAAACIPVDLELPAEDCSGSHHDGERESCDLHGHLKPVVKERGNTVADVPALLETAEGECEPLTAGIPIARNERFHSPPLLQRSSILRI
jgi:hypothetical protein